MTTTALALPQEQQLDTLVSQSGLELNQGEQIKQSYLPYFIQLAEIKAQASKINFENPTELDEKIARELRLKTVKIRTGSKDVKDDRKKIHALKANLEQDAWNLIKSTCELEEEQFFQVENRRAQIEKQRIESIRLERIAQIEPYASFVPVGLPLGTMSDDDFSMLLSGAKLNHQAKIDAEAKAELERIEKELALEKERERIRLENERLKKEAEEREAAMKAERLEAEKKAEAIKAKADAEKKASEEKARKEREAIEAKLKAERLERERLEAEKAAKEKADREEKARIEAAQKAAEKERIAAEAKAAKAPLKEKMRVWVSAFTIPSGQPDCMGAVIIAEKFEAFKKWAEAQIEEI